MSADARAKCRAEGYCDAATFIRAARAAGGSHQRLRDANSHLNVCGHSLRICHCFSAVRFRRPRWGDSSPIFGVKIPAGYRQWELIAPSHEEGFDELRGILGNASSTRAYRDGTLPFLDGAILAKLAWKRVPSSEFKGAFVPGAPATLQIMVKDSKKMPRRVAGVSAGSLTGSPWTRRNTKLASPATKPT